MHSPKYLDRIIVSFSLFDSAQSDRHAERSRSINCCIKFVQVLTRLPKVTSYVFNPDNQH